MQSKLRKKLNGTSFRNQSLQDILTSSAAADKVISVEPFSGGVHNTKIVFGIADDANNTNQEHGDKRVQFYNRLDLVNILSEVDLKPSALSVIITELNNKGYDFTEDDLELTPDGFLRAKAGSLGYIGQLLIGTPIQAILDHQGMELPFFSPGFYGPNGEENLTHLEFKMIIGSRPEPIVYTYQSNESNPDLGLNSSDGFLAAWLAAKWNQNNLYDELSLMISSQNSPGFLIQNLLDRPNSFELVVTVSGRKSSSIEDGWNIYELYRIGVMNLLPFNERVAPSADDIHTRKNISDGIFIGRFTDLNDQGSDNPRVAETLISQITEIEISFNKNPPANVTMAELAEAGLEYDPYTYLDAWLGSRLSFVANKAGFQDAFYIGERVFSNRSLDYLIVEIRAKVNDGDFEPFIEIELGNFENS